MRSYTYGLADGSQTNSDMFRPLSTKHKNSLNDIKLRASQGDPATPLCSGLDPREALQHPLQRDEHAGQAWSVLTADLLRLQRRSLPGSPKPKPNGEEALAQTRLQDYAEMAVTLETTSGALNV